MIACDVSVLVYAYNLDEARHDAYREWLETALNGERPFGLPSLVASGFLRHPLDSAPAP